MSASSVGARRSGDSALGELASPVYSTVVLTVCAGFGALALWRTHTASQEAAAAAREAEAQRAAAAAQAALEGAPEPESFERTVDRCFGETLRLDDFMLSLTSVLREVGFTRDNTLMTLSLPRDPLMNPVREQLQKVWGDGVCLSSLSGLPLLGHTGLRAACGAHDSDASGRRGNRRTLIVCRTGHVFPCHSFSRTNLTSALGAGRVRSYRSRRRRHCRRVRSARTERLAANGARMLGPGPASAAPL